MHWSGQGGDGSNWKAVTAYCFSDQVEVAGMRHDGLSISGKSRPRWARTWHTICRPQRIEADALKLNGKEQRIAYRAGSNIACSSNDEIGDTIIHCPTDG